MTSGHPSTDVFQKLIPPPSAIWMAGKGNEPMKPSRRDADLSYTLSRAVFWCEKGVVGLSSRNYVLQKLIPAPSAFGMAGKGNEPMKPLRSDDLSSTLSRAIFRCEKGVVGLSSCNYKSELE
ncbi:hypothetical protein CDAR_122681 [Caerostris darwini]|uniref:Uncharacterized protein n=1 Tax=Caerostris darwini TaxID=1538125 RepID=A0AAV4UZR2_9ARAC|nr:hypothetical protein CDAR_122681 [Caerostris darwini]